MGLFDAFRRGGRGSHHVVGRISDDPQVVGDNGTRYLVFHISEAPDTEFRLKMLPTTPKRRRGDRVDLTWTPDANGIALVEALYAAPDPDAIRRRNEANMQGAMREGAKDH